MQQPPSTRRLSGRCVAAQSPNQLSSGCGAATGGVGKKDCERREARGPCDGWGGWLVQTAVAASGAGGVSTSRLFGAENKGTHTEAAVAKDARGEEE